MKTGSQREICSSVLTAALLTIAKIWKQPKWPSADEWMGFPGSSAGKESACNAGDPSSIAELGRSPRGGIRYPLQYSWASLVAQMVRNPTVMRETWVDPWVGKIPWRRAWQPTPVFLPGESPWTEKPGGLQSMGLQRVTHD